MNLLTKDAILKVQDLPMKRIKVREWGGHLFIRTMTGLQREEFEAVIRKHKESEAGKTGPAGGSTAVLAALVVMTVADADGNLLFTSEDIPALQSKSADPVIRVAKAAMKLNAVTDKDVSELEGKSESSQSDDSGSS